MCHCHGFMIHPEDGTRKSYKLFEAGANREGWFTNVDLVQQLDDCYELFRQFHPDCDIVIP